MLHYEKNVLFICLNLLMIGLCSNLYATTTMGSMTTSSMPPPSCPIITWQVVPTGENHTLVVPLDANPTFEGNPLPAGTLIGVFNTAGELWGFSTWDAENDIAITVYGDDGDTLGFEVGELFNFRIELPSGVISETVEVTYSDFFIFSHTDTYEHDGISGFASFAASNGLSVLPPTIVFSQVIDGTTVSFANTTSHADTYEWTFGNGESSTLENPEYDYNDFGTYEVCLTASNDCFSETLCQTITIADGSGCNDVIHGGTIGESQIICPTSPDPAELTNISSPSGGTGELEYIWIFTTDHPDAPTAAWHILHHTNSPSYDPPTLEVTTWFRRCVRTTGCPQFVQESNIVQITVADDCMENLDCDDFQVNALATPITCHGRTDGLIDAHVIGGTSPYLLQWAHDLDRNFAISALEAGMYEVSVTDANGCDISTTALVVEPAPLQFIEERTTKCGETELIIIPSGGVEPYTLAWTHDIESNESIVATTSGDYFLNMTDAHACQVQAEFSVEVVPMLQVQKNETPATCEMTGQVDFGITGGQAPYFYEWNTAIPDMETLATGQYQVTILDSGVCSVELAVQIEENCLRFTSFEAQLNEFGEVELDWEIMDEFSSGRYFIEQSKDNQQFSTKSVLESKINIPNETGTYQAIDQAHLGTNFYRIRYIDAGGYSTFSPVQSVVYRPDALAEVLTYPNPFEAQIEVDFLEPLTEDRVLRIRNAYGQLLREVEVSTGAIRAKVDMSDFDNGLYWIDYGKRQSVKVVKGL